MPDAPGKTVRLVPVPLALVLLGIYLMSGMRAYFGLLILGLLGSVLFLRGVALIREERRMPWRYAGAVVVVLAVVWAGCRVGGGPYYQTLVEPVDVPVTTRLERAFEWCRERSASAMARGRGRRRRGRPAVGRGTVAPGLRGFRRRHQHGVSRAQPRRRRRCMSRVGGVMLGLGAVFVPVSLLRATGLVSFQGGSRSLLLTDIDTLFIDITIVACLVLVWRRRRDLRGAWTLTVFLLVLGVVSAVLVGYVVTNYGTLFRLRLLAVVPFWLLPLVLARPAAPPVARA